MRAEVAVDARRLERGIGGDFCAEFVEFLQREADADDERRFAGDPVAVGRGDERAVGQQFQAGIGAIGALVVVHQPHAILPLTAVGDIVVGANPSDPVTVSRTLVCRVAERDEQPPVRRVAGDMAVAGERAGQFARLAPCLAFVVGENDE